MIRSENPMPARKLGAPRKRSRLRAVVPLANFVAWTVIPILIVVVLLVAARTIGDVENANPTDDALKVRVVGHQWLHPCSRNLQSLRA